MLNKPYDLIQFVEDRAGHDPCYYMDWTKLRALGWQPEHDFADTMERTVRWYAEHRDWWEPIKSGDFRRYYEPVWRSTRERPPVRRHDSWRVAATPPRYTACLCVFSSLAVRGNSVAASNARSRRTARPTPA